MRVDLRAYGGGDVALIDSCQVIEVVPDPITVG